LFSSAPQTVPLRSRVWGIALGTIIMVGTPTMIVSAKTVQATLPILLAAALGAAAARGRIACAKPRLNGAVLSLFALIAYAALSGLWAPDWQLSVSISLMAAVVALGTIVLITLLHAESAEDALHMGEGLWIGLLVGALYTVLEIMSGQSIKIWAYNTLGLGPDELQPARYFTWKDGRVIAVHPDDLTRNAVPIPLLIWPALMATRALPAHLWRPAVSATLFLLCAAAVLLATSETAKLALFAGVIAFAAARFSWQMARYALSVAWIAACLSVVPAAYLARQLDLQTASWLQLSARLRIIIWNEIARLVPEAPILGHGADMTYVLQPVTHEGPTPDWGTFVIPHPHNVYLQTWYELGLAGAVLLAIFGFMLLRQISTLTEAARPFAFALFAAAAVQLAFSYNLWQIWFMCLFGFAVAMGTLGNNVLAHRKSQPR